MYSNIIMMTSSNGNIFRVTGPLCGEFTGHRWIPLTKASDAGLWCFFDLCLNNRWSKQSWGWWFETPLDPLKRHCNAILPQHYTRGLECVAWWIGYVMPCQMASHCVIFILISIFVMILYLYIGIIVLYAHTSARTLWTCRGWPVPGRCRSRRTNSGPLVIRCDTINGIWNQMMKYYSGVTSSWWWCLC